MRKYTVADTTKNPNPTPAPTPPPQPTPAPAPAPAPDPEKTATEDEQQFLIAEDIADRQAAQPPEDMRTSMNYRLSPAEKQFLREFGDVVAAPLVQGDFLNLKPKNPAMIFRWINRIGLDGQRYESMKYAGFVNAKAEDVKGFVASNLIREGNLVVGDTICMMIPKDKYYAALKYNHERASRSARRGLVNEDLVSDVQRRSVPEGAPPELKRKIRAYTPDEKEMQKVFGEK